MHAKALGMKPEEFQAPMAGMTHTRRLTTLGEPAAAVFAAGVTGTTLNPTAAKAAD